MFEWIKKRWKLYVEECRQEAAREFPNKERIPAIIVRAIFKTSRRIGKFGPAPVGMSAGDWHRERIQLSWDARRLARQTQAAHGATRARRL